MNASNITHPMAVYYASINDAMYQCSWASLCCMIGQLILLSLIAWREMKCDHDHKLKCLSPINIQIALISITYTLYINLSVVNNLFSQVPIPIRIGLYITSDLSYYLFQFLVIYYTHCRAFPIIKSSAKWSLPIFRGIVFTFGILVLFRLIVSWVFDMVSFSSNFGDILVQVYNFSTSVGMLVSEVLTSAFEVGSLILFVAYLRKSRAEGVAIQTHRLTIVARFGIASFWCFQAYLIISVAIDFILLAPNPVVSLTFFESILYAQQNLPLLYVFLQIWMKWSVHVAREAFKSKSDTRI
ncbi:hypothetical protein BC830DRAFT_544202 [Chytriomyces sp. MP71]|nr:hypothetical protein BC830DRAFT_544202 [Chytriomyces sp. MP71]